MGANIHLLNLKIIECKKSLFLSIESWPFFSGQTFKQKDA